jgi:hypothetical protein
MGVQDFQPQDELVCGSGSKQPKLSVCATLGTALAALPSRHGEKICNQVSSLSVISVLSIITIVLVSVVTLHDIFPLPHVRQSSPVFADMLSM